MGTLHEATPGEREERGREREERERRGGGRGRRERGEEGGEREGRGREREERERGEGGREGGEREEEGGREGERERGEGKRGERERDQGRESHFFGPVAIYLYIHTMSCMQKYTCTNTCIHIKRNCLLDYLHSYSAYLFTDVYTHLFVVTLVTSKGLNLWVLACS